MNDPHDNALDDKAILEKLTAMSAETESILRENAETRADLGLDTTPAGDTFDAATGEVPWDGFKDGRIQNFLGLDWAGRKLLEYERGIAQNEACHAEFLRRVEEDVARYRAKLMGRSVERLAELQAPLREKAAFFRAAVESYAKEVGRKGICIGSAKSRELPCGVRLAWRKTGGVYRWDEKMKPAEREAALLRWADYEAGTTGECLTHDNPAPDLDAIKRHLKLLGDEERAEALKGQSAPPGLEYVPEHEELTVRVESDK